jgi:hypothetical protein
MWSAELQLRDLRVLVLDQCAAVLSEDLARIRRVMRSRYVSATFN